MSKNYALLYIPDLDTNAENINFVCSDNKIHFRFKDFIRPECIQGFEKKLTYLMTYLINSKNDIDNKNTKNYLNQFLKSEDVESIIAIISNNISNLKFKGLQARFNYNKVDYKQYPFGNINRDYFPYLENTKNDLKQFLSKFKISLRDYLFNDKYVIILTDNKIKDVNLKFKNKEERSKLNNIIDNCFVKLW